jgi:hypothetical protein
MAKITKLVLLLSLFTDPVTPPPTSSPDADQENF